MLTNKLVLCTGATSGIGQATVRVMLSHGAKVVATGRNESVLKELYGESSIPFIAADLSVEGSATKVVDSAVASLSGLTTVVNCAGVLQGGAFGSAACNLENFMFNFNVNTKAVFEIMTAAVPHLRAAGADRNPSIVNVSSVNGMQSFGGVASYCASKAALDMLSKCAAVDLASDGIRVNCVNPGVVVTELQKRGGMNDEAYEKFLERSVSVTHPLGAALNRVAEPAEVAELISFLSSDNAKFITGDTIKIDGGRSCVGAR